MSLLSLPPFSRVRLVGVLAVSQVIGWGTTFDMVSVMARPMADDFGLPLGVLFSGLTVMMLVGGLAGPAIGTALKRFGATHVLAVGSVVTGSGLGLLSLSTGAISYFAAWVIIGLGGGLALSVPAYAAAVEREGAAARISIGALMLFTGVSSTIFWPILAALNGAFGWRTTLAIAAALHFLVCLPLHLFAFSAVRREVAPVSDASVSSGPRLTASGRRHVFLLIAAVTVTFSFTTFGLAAAFLELLMAAGATPDYALWLGTIRPVLGICARAIDLVSGGRAGPVAIAIVSTALMGASFALLGVGAGGAAMLAVFVVLYGLGAGLSAVARAVLPLAFFPPAEFGRQSGRLSLPQNVANAIAPVIFVALADHLGALAAALLGLALMAVALASGLLLAKLTGNASTPEVGPPGPVQELARP